MQNNNNNNNNQNEIEFAVEKINKITEWTDGSKYRWENWGKKYNKQTFKGIKRHYNETMIRNIGDKQCRWYIKSYYL